MKKAAVIYWSGTGNTQEMANAVCEGLKEAGAETVLFTPDQVSASDIAAFDAVAMGCPAMGAEVLEDSEFEPMYDAIKGSLTGKAVALFGSYGWGDGEWMRNWESDCKDNGLNLVCDSVTCCDSPDDDAKAACKALGAALANA